MENKKQKETKERMIHVRLPENMHKMVRICAAETDQTIQDWVFGIVKHELDRHESIKMGSRE